MFEILGDILKFRGLRRVGNFVVFWEIFVRRFFLRKR